jgi:hypothetical protein
MIPAKQLIKGAALTASFLIASTLFLSNCIAQESGSKEKKIEKEERFVPHSQLGIILGHAHVFEGRDEFGKRKHWICHPGCQKENKQYETSLAFNRFFSGHKNKLTGESGHFGYQDKTLPLNSGLCFRVQWDISV